MIISVIWLLLFVSILLADYPADHSFFFLGDSVTRYLHNSLARLLKCHILDPNTELVVEPKTTKSFYCPSNSSSTFRLGGMRHWGVSRTDGDFFSIFNSKKHQDEFPLRHTNSSILNIKLSVHEFKNRSRSDKQVTYVFFSSLWDSHRYLQRYRGKKDKNSRKNWLSEYKLNYTIAVAEILGQLFPLNASLVLQTQYHVSIDNELPIDELVSPMNAIVREVAAFFNLPVFDTDIIMRGVSLDASTYLKDYVHLNDDNFMMLARYFLKQKWTYYNWRDNFYI